MGSRDEGQGQQASCLVDHLLSGSFLFTMKCCDRSLSFPIVLPISVQGLGKQSQMLVQAEMAESRLSIGLGLRKNQ